MARRVPAWMSGDGDAIGEALTFILIPLLFGAFGRWLDGVFGISPVLMLVLGIFGLVGVFLAVYYRYQARIAELDQDKPWTRPT